MTRADATTVSVCIPTYRGAAHLGTAIESVLAQSLGDFELVIIDDNSPDNTAEVVARYRDPRIRYLRNSINLGPQGNWNRCLAEARGRYFKLLPQDDSLASQCLERQVAILEQDKTQRLALVFCARRIIDSQDRAVMVRGYPRGREGIIPSARLIGRCLRYGTNLIGEPGSVLLRRKLADRVGGFDASEPYVIDLDYWFRLLLHGDGYYVPEPLVTFRVSPGSWSVAIGAKQSVDFRRFMSRIAGDSRYSVRRFDIVIGEVMARLNNILRLLLYRFALR